MPDMRARFGLFDVLVAVVVGEEDGELVGMWVTLRPRVTLADVGRKGSRFSDDRLLVAVVVHGSWQLALKVLVEHGLSSRNDLVFLLHFK